MVKLKFSKEQRIINALMVNAYSIKDIGLINGKMGVVLYIYAVSRSLKNYNLSDYANSLLENIIKSLHSKSPINFTMGITGIGWALEYLIQNEYIIVESDIILEDADTIINKKLIHDSNKDVDTVISIGYYYISRLHYRVNDEDNMKVLDLKYNVILLIEELEKQINKGEEHLQLYHLLTELRKLNIYNHKIDKLLKTLKPDNTEYLFPFIPKLSKEQVEQQLNQKDVESRHAGFELKDISEDEKYGLKHGIAGIGLQYTLNRL